MRPRKPVSFSEVLECRMVLSAVMAAPLVEAAAPLHTSPVFGSIKGTYTEPHFIGTDAGITNNFTGKGTLPTFGDVKLSGTLQGTGNIAHGNANGEITLSNSNGSVTLYLTGPTQGMFAPLPKSFQFKVVSGTGDFASLQMTGTIHLTEHPKAGKFVMSFASVQIHDPSTLKGSGSGNYTMGLNVDSGPLLKLKGTASLELLGEVNVSGSVQGTGFTTSGQATGTVTLSNKLGSVTLILTGPVQSGFSPLPTHFQFKVVGATGAYKGLTMTGSIDLMIDSTTSTSLLGRGAFSFKIHPDLTTTLL